MKKYNFIFKILLVLFIGPDAVWSQDRPLHKGQDIIDADKKYMPEAIAVKITPKGQKLFNDELDLVLGNLGVRLSEGYFDAQKVESEKPVDLEGFRELNPKAVEAYEQLKKMLSQWLVGFSLNPHRPAFEIGPSGYVATFEKFGLYADQKLLNSLNKKDGAVLVIEMKIPSLVLMSSGVKVWDMNNDFLGELGLSDVTLEGTSENKPLWMRLPFYIRLNENKRLYFEALKVEENLKEFPTRLNYTKLLIPEFAVEINGRRYPINSKELQKLINSQEQVIVNKIKENLSLFATKRLPEILNQKAKQHLTDTLEQVQNMAPPAKPESRKQDPDFKWGLRLSKLTQKDSINISLDAYVEDPINLKSKPDKAAAARGLPIFNLLPEQNYDVGLSVDRGIVNRAVQLSFARGYFNNLQTSSKSEKEQDTTKNTTSTVTKSTSLSSANANSCANGANSQGGASTPALSLVKSPVVDFVNIASSNPGQTFIQLKAQLKLANDGLGWQANLALRDQIVVDLTVIGYLASLPERGSNELYLIFSDIDLQTAQVTKDSISRFGRLFKKTIAKELNKILTQVTDCWKKEPYVVASLPFPPKILGLDLGVEKVHMDEKGNLVMYLSYVK